MSRPLFFAALPILLCACTMVSPTPTKQPQATPIVAQGEQRAANTQAVQTATPNEAGTLAVMALQATERAVAVQAVSMAYTLTAEAKNDLRIAQTEARAPIDRATGAAARKTGEAQVKLQMTAAADHATWTAAAPIVAATSARLLEDAKNAPVRSFGEAWSSIVGTSAMLVFSITLAVYLWATWYAQNQAAQVAEDEAEQEEDEAPAQIEPRGESLATQAANVPVDIRVRFFEWALAGNGLSIRVMEDAGVIKKADRAYRQTLIAYLYSLGHIKHDALIMSDDGIDFWYSRYQRPPSPEGDTL